MRAVVQALMLERGLLYVLRAEQNPFSKRLRVEQFAFRLSAFKVFGGADSVCSGTWEGRTSVVLSGALRSTVAASSDFTGEKDSAGAFTGAR